MSEKEQIESLRFQLAARDAQIKILQDSVEYEAAQVARLEDAILWALGEKGEFGEEPKPLAGKYRRRFWWRTELRQRAFGDPSQPVTEREP